MLTRSEAQRYLRTSELPVNFRERVKLIVEFGNFEPYNNRLLAKSEAKQFLSSDTLPPDFKQKVENSVKYDVCENCDNRLCTGCICREYGHDCRPDCPCCCECLKCGDLTLIYFHEGSEDSVKCESCGWTGSVDELCPIDEEHEIIKAMAQANIDEGVL